MVTTNFSEILTYSIGGNSLKGYLLALAVFLLMVVALKFFKFVVIKKVKKFFAKTKGELDDLVINSIDQIGWPFYLLLSFYTSLQFIQIPMVVERVFYYVTMIVVTYYVIRGLQELIDYSTKKLIQKRQKEKKEDTSIIDLLSRILKGLLWGTAIVLILANLGYDISTLLAGLGIGGLAIAFALQNVLTDVFASFSIYFDKPFEVGDFIVTGDDLGVVKKIGIKSTRLQSLWGQEIVISNQELTSTRINNYKKMEKRRIQFSFGVVYETPTKKLKKIPKIVKEIFSKIKLADLDRVHFKEFGDFSLDFEVAYYVDTGDYNKYMDTRQEINFALKERLEREGIAFAYPTQTVFVNK